ncbi:MAG TPA: methionine synthase [Geodermatophilus sp.]|nr:methionine synthase [Geodermatophilus sp.]
MPPRDLLTALSEQVVVADGAMGTMLQAAHLTLDDFEGHEGCNEILNVTRPDVVRGVHDAYFAAGSDAVETNTFGANWANLGEYGIADRIEELARAGAALAREVADGWTTPDRPRWVLGAVGPGTKLPTLGHVPYATLRDAYQQQTAGMLAGGIDAVIVETAQDLLQAKAAILGAKRAMAAAGRTVPLIAHVTVETTGTMLLGSEIGAAVTALEPLGIDLLGLNCATGPAEMSEHLRHVSRHFRGLVSVMPNAGLPELGPDGAVYPLGPEEMAAALRGFVTDYGARLVGGCCGTTPEHIRALVAAVDGVTPAARAPEREPGVSSIYQAVSFRQDAGVLMVGERTNANGSKAFREAMLEGRLDDCVEIARGQIRDGAHLLDLNVDYVGRDGVADMRALAARLATASTLPIMLDSTEPEVIEAGLEMLGGRCIVNSVNFEDGEGPQSRFARVMPVIREHGAATVALTIDEEGQARTAEWKVRVATRLIETLTARWGMAVGDIVVDPLTFPIGTGQEETRRDGIETIEAIRELKRRFPEVQTTLGVSNVSFGLSPAGRQVLNSVFLHECVEAGLDSAIVHASKILPMSKIPDEQRQAALDLVYDQRREGFDPLQRFLEVFSGVSTASSRESRAAELAAMPLAQRLQARIVDGERNGLTQDLDEALRGKPALAIINEDLLAGMKTVGELFGSGAMQLPFVLQSAEVMKAAVAHLEPHMEKADSAGKGTIVLATVKGDVHDIGKNLVDIILTNNGYTVVNLGIKQPITTILEAAEQHEADAIGMSGLLVKSTVVMKENLEEMNARGIAERFPVLLGGAALTRGYVESDLSDLFHGEVHYARDAFEGLRLMDAVVAARRGGGSVPDAATPRAADEQRRAERRARRERSARIAEQRRAAESPEEHLPARSATATDNPVPRPPFWGSRVVKGIATAEYAALLDERATFLGQWGLRAARGGEGPSYEELVETEGRPRLRYWLDRLQTDGVLEAAVTYGYFPCFSEGDDLVVLEAGPGGAPGGERERFTFPRQRRDARLCLADYFKAKDSGEIDVVAFMVVTVGRRISDYANKLFAADAYRDYLEVHGLSVQLTEALTEYWHQRVRSELVLPDGTPVGAQDGAGAEDFFKLHFRGCRYGFGYPACPDLSQQQQVMRLLEPERIGVTLSEEFQLDPEQSTSALISHHPEATYFNAR